jgi:hypothetical protein
MAHNLHIERELDYGLEHKGSQWFYNNSSADLDVGDVVILDVSDLAGKSVTTTTSAGNTKVVGVCQTRAVDGKRVKVNFEGVSTVKVNGTTDIVAGSTYLKSYTEAGIASAASSNAESGVFGLALSGYTANNSLGEVSIKLAQTNTQGGVTGAEAIAAVEGETTLVLAGDVSINGSKSLSVDVINEKDAAAGVTIDSVLLKDGLVDGVDVAARDHAKYTDAEAISAVEGADLAFSDLASLTSGNILVGNGSGVAASVNPSGDVDITNAGVFSIASGSIIDDDVKSDAAIAYSKLAALADGNILVGSGSNVAVSVNPSGDVDVSNAGVFTVANDAITLAKMAHGTDGQIITYDADQVPIAVGPGTDGQVLTSTGAGSPPAFENAAAGYSDAEAIAAVEAETTLVLVGDVSIADAKSIKLGGARPADDEPASNNTGYGIVILFDAGAAVAIGDAVSIGTDGRVIKTVADATGTLSGPCIGIATTAAGSADDDVYVMTHGIFRHDDWGLTAGSAAYIEEADPGDLSATAPNDDGDYVQRVGVAVKDDVLLVMPSIDVIEHA